MARAVERRAPLAADPRTTAYRLIHGAADGLPGVAVDRFGDVLVANLRAADPRLDQLVEALLDAAGPLRAVYVKVHPRQASRLDPAERDALAPSAPVWGQAVDSTVVLEEGRRYEIRPGAGLSVGLFLDMREVRRWLAEQAAGRSLLNLFAYTCGFGLCATLGGATRALNLDTSRPYLDWGQQNYRLNDCPVDPRDFVQGDAFDWLARFRRRGERFDVVVVDPPSYSTTRTSRFSVERDLTRLVGEAARVVADRGILIAATNHAGIPPERFDAMLVRGLAEADRVGRTLRRWHEPTIDFPLAPRSRPSLKVQALVVQGG